MELCDTVKVLMMMMMMSMAMGLQGEKDKGCTTLPGQSHDISFVVCFIQFSVNPRFYCLCSYLHMSKLTPCYEK